MDYEITDYPEFIQGYFRYLTVVKNLSPRTISAYSVDIRTFLRYLKMTKLNLPFDTFTDIKVSDVPFEWFKTLTLNDTYQFLFFATEKLENHSLAIARKVSAVKGLFKYLTTKEHLLDKNPVKDLELPSLKKSLPKFLSLDQSKDLLESVDSSFPERDYCIITLFVNCGMRLSELVGLNIKDINLTERTMRLLGKGNKERIIYINAACIDALNEYMSVRKNTAKEPDALFLSSFGKRISRRRVQQIVETTLKQASLSGRGLSTHKLRHTAATLMYQYGDVDPLILKEILGHKSIATTEIYTHVSNKQLKQAADKSPLAEIKPKKSRKKSDTEK